MRLHFLQQSLLFQLRDDRLACVEAVESCVGPRLLVQRTVRVQHVHDSQAVPLACLEVVGVMPRCDLERPRAELGCNRIVDNDRDKPPQHRQSHPLALCSRVPFIHRVDRDRRVAEQRLWAGRCDGQVPGAVLVEIADVVQVALYLLVFNLEIG